MHNVIPNAKAYIATLQARLLRLRGTICCNAPVRELVRENGRVSGVVACIDGQSTYLQAARGVVLATGDSVMNSWTLAQLLADFLGVDVLDKTEQEVMTANPFRS